MLYWYETIPSCRPAEWRLIRPRATDPYRNAWPLNWCRRKAYTFNLVMFAVITERFPAPESRYDIERLVKSLAENPWSDLLSKPAVLYFSLSTMPTSRINLPLDSWSIAAASRATCQGKRLGRTAIALPMRIRLVLEAIAASPTKVSVAGSCPSA